MIRGEQTVLSFLAALILPGLLVILFSRITYSPIIGLILTIALITASAYKGYTDTLLLIISDSFSMTIGYYISRKRKKQASSNLYKHL